MKNRKMTLASCACMLLALMVTACGSNSSDSTSYSKSEASANYLAQDSASYAEADYGFADTVAESSYEEAAGGESVKVNDTSRKLITTVNMDIETDDFDSMLGAVEGRITSFGGYIESSSVYKGSGSSYKSRYSSITARIPAEKLEDFLDFVSENGNITNKDVSVSDVTLQYVDVEAKLDSLKTQQKRLLELMEAAETVEDIITIEDRLSQIRYELESAERQIRSYDNQVDYSTVYLYISEVVKYTPVEEPGRWERMISGFMESIEGVCEGFLDFVVDFVIVIPYLIVFGIILFIIFIVIKLIIKSNKKKREKKLLEYQKSLQMNYKAQMEKEAKAKEDSEEKSVEDKND